MSGTLQVSERTDTKIRKNKALRNLNFFLGFLLISIVALTAIFELHTSKEQHKSGYWYYGFSGKVVDMDTGKPIEGALVYFYVSTDTISACDAETKAFNWLALQWCQRDDLLLTTFTNASGEYFIPEGKVKSFEKQNKKMYVGWGEDYTRSPGEFYIIKPGYVYYNSLFIFPCRDRRTDFKERDNVVKLEPWRPYYFHSEHTSFAPDYLHSNNKFKGLFSWEDKGYKEESNEYHNLIMQYDPKGISNKNISCFNLKNLKNNNRRDLP